MTMQCPARPDQEDNKDSSLDLVSSTREKKIEISDTKLAFDWSTQNLLIVDWLNLNAGENCEFSNCKIVTLSLLFSLLSLRLALLEIFKSLEHTHGRVIDYTL